MPYKLHPPGERGPHWYVRGTASGVRYEISTGTADREAAERFAKDHARRLGDTPRAAPVTFGEAANAFILWRHPGRADLGLIERLVKDHLGSRRVVDIRHADLVEVGHGLYPRGSNATKNRKVIGPAAAVLHYAADQGWCEYRRFKKFPVPRRSPRQPASEEAVAALLGATEGHKHLLLAVLYETGLRITDAVRLAWPDVDLKAGRIMVRIAKTDEKAFLPMSPALLALFANMPKAGFRIFPWSGREGVYKWLRPLVRKLGVTYTPHLSRHALATWMLQQGIPDRQAAEQGVWRDERSLHRYQHVQPIVTGRTVATLSPIKTGGRARKSRK